MKDTIQGGCLCGKVSFSIKNAFKQFYFCHCQQCRKITGSDHAANLFAEPGNIQWHSGADTVIRYEDPKRDFTKAFCAECGCGLPFVTKNGKALLVPAGTLEDAPHIDVAKNIFWQDRAPWYEQGLEAERCDAFPT